MRGRKLLFNLLVVLGMVLLTAGLVWAEEHGGGGALQADKGTNFIFRIVNFIIFAAIIWFAAGKKIVGGLKSRRYNIETELDDLSRQKADAEIQLKEVSSRIANLESERQQMLEEYRQQGEALKASIVEKAQKQAEQIKAQAEMTAANEARRAAAEVREKMADLIMEAARTIVEEKLSQAEHEKLIDEYVTKVVLN